MGVPERLDGSGSAGHEDQPDAADNQNDPDQLTKREDTEKSEDHLERVLTAARPFWTDPTISVYPQLVENAEAEVVVIGGGISGVGAARWLVESGVEEVAVLEARTICSGASGRNAGFVMAVAPENFPPSDDPQDHEIARAIWSFTDTNQRLMEQTIVEMELNADFRRRGSLGLAAYPDEWDLIKATAEIARENGLAVEIIERADLPGEWLTQEYYGGAWFPGNAEINPASFVKGVAARLAAGGVQIFENSPVLEIADDGEHHYLRTANAVLRAKGLVVATNGYTSALLPDFENLITPIRGQVLATSKVEDGVVECPVYANDGFQYWRQTADGSVLVGGWRDLDIRHEVGRRENLNSAIQTRLEQVARKICSPKRIRISNRWAGIMGFTPDRRPLVGWIPGMERAVICAGFSGHGLAMAYHASKEAVSILLDEGSEWSDLFDPRRFGP